MTTRPAAVCTCYPCKNGKRTLLRVGAVWADGHQEHRANAIAARLVRRGLVAGVKLHPREAKGYAGNLVGSQGTDHIAQRAPGLLADTKRDGKAMLVWSTQRWQFFSYGPVYGIWPGAAEFWGASRLWMDWHVATTAAANTNTEAPAAARRTRSAATLTA
jgi:hypothetical protein